LIQEPTGVWLIIQNSLPFLWLKNCLDQHDLSRRNIKTTNDIFSYIHLQLLKDQEISAKQTENMFTGTSADQQRKDASAARYPVRPNIHAITESSPTEDPVVDLEPPTLDVILPSDEEYSYQDEAEAIASLSYDNDDFNYDNRSVLYSDILDQKSYIQYEHETYSTSIRTKILLRLVPSPLHQSHRSTKKTCPVSSSPIRIVTLVITAHINSEKKRLQSTLIHIGRSHPLQESCA